MKRAGEAGKALRAALHDLNEKTDQPHNFAVSLRLGSRGSNVAFSIWGLSMDNYHITKDGDKWKLQKEGNERPSKTADTKAELIQKTREFMSDKQGSVKIHKENGRIQEERTYPRKDDPTKSKG